MSLHIFLPSYISSRYVYICSLETCLLALRHLLFPYLFFLFPLLSCSIFTHSSHSLNLHYLNHSASLSLPTALSLFVPASLIWHGFQLLLLIPLFLLSPVLLPLTPNQNTNFPRPPSFGPRNSLIYLSLFPFITLSPLSLVLLTLYQNTSFPRSPFLSSNFVIYPFFLLIYLYHPLLPSLFDLPSFSLSHHARKKNFPKISLLCPRTYNSWEQFSGFSMR